MRKPWSNINLRSQSKSLKLIRKLSPIYRLIKHNFILNINFYLRNIVTKNMYSGTVILRILKHQNNENNI